tara:strand:- start:230 stop:832 length:603 start_codon:yes stop_codon:yes gene_type:complete
MDRYIDESEKKYRPRKYLMRWLAIIWSSTLSFYASAEDSKSFIIGDSVEFRQLIPAEESSAWAWCAATANFAADLLKKDEVEVPVVRELSNIAESSENAIFSLYWWQYEMQLYRKQDSLKYSSSAHNKRMKEFRELAREMVEERNDQILAASRRNIEYRASLEERIRNTLILCEGNVEGMEYYSQLWNGWMAANRAKLNF